MPWHLKTVDDIYKITYILGARVFRTLQMTWSIWKIQWTMNRPPTPDSGHTYPCNPLRALILIITYHYTSTTVARGIPASSPWGHFVCKGCTVPASIRTHTCLSATSLCFEKSYGAVQMVFRFSNHIEIPAFLQHRNNDWTTPWLGTLRYVIVMYCMPMKRRMCQNLRQYIFITNI